jgi:predicted 3-demethylubiquinone-9 3-methyltransferase (glyoxalase superfamily)
MHSVKPFLWFNGQAEEAAKFYVSVFRNSKMGDVLRYGEGGPGQPGSVMTATFEIDGIEFVALNGGPQYTFTPAISFAVACRTQAEIDDLWEKLTADGGQEVACGWLQDKFGLSWQVVPANIAELLQGRDAEGGQRAMQAMMQMKKLDIDTLARAGGLA